MSDDVRVGVSLTFDGGRNRGMDALAGLAAHAEAVGLASLWLPEHVVFVEGAVSRYPYGELRLGRRPGVYDPIVGLTVAATATSRIRLGTGVLILPQREPVVLAQQVAALDHAAAGRVDLGIGVGWQREESEALGVPWAGRGERADEYVEVLRALWRDDVVHHDGPRVHLHGVLAWPKPVQRPGVPVWVGGNTGPALRRAGRLGDGWFGWGLDAGAAADAVEQVRRAAADVGRDPASVGLMLGLPWPGPLAELGGYLEAVASIGIGQVVVHPLDGTTDPRRRLDELATLAP